MKCGNAFTKVHLNVCPVKEIVCNNCKYKRHFGRLCKSKGRKPAVNIVDESVNSQNCSYSPEDLQARSEENFCGVINAWTEEGTSDNDDYFVLNIRTIYDTNGLETKKLVNIGLGDNSIVNLNIPVDSASPVSFLKHNVLHELKTRNQQLKIHPVEKKIRELYCEFTNDTINIIGKVVVRLQSNGWIADELLIYIVIQISQEVPYRVKRTLRQLSLSQRAQAMTQFEWTALRRRQWRHQKLRYLSNTAQKGTQVPLKFRETGVLLINSSVDSEDEPLITFSSAKSTRSKLTYCTASPSDYLTPFEDIPRHTTLVTETTQGLFSTPSSRTTKAACVASRLVEVSSNTQDDDGSDISSGIDADVRREADYFHDRYNGTTLNSENF